MKTSVAAFPLTAALMCLALAACASKEELVAEKTDMLSAAGFTVRPANTPERQAALQSLPPHQFVQETRGNRIVYLYADPLVCNCLYIGDQEAYGRYQRQALALRISNQRLLAAQLRADAAWNWGMWGPGWW